MPRQAISPIINYKYYAKSISNTSKRTKRVNGTVLTPEMVVTVTTQMHTFYNGAKKVQEAYMRLYNFDYKKHVAL